MRPLPIVLIAAIGFASAALAHKGVKDPNVKAWMHSMGLAGQSSKALGNMVKGKATYDAAAALAAKDTLIEVSGSLAILFETKSADPVSEALPAIWDNYDDFTAKAEAMQAAATALDVSSVEAIGLGLRDLAQTCRGCHRAYRE